MMTTKTLIRVLMKSSTRGDTKKIGLIHLLSIIPTSLSNTMHSAILLLTK